MKLKYFSAVVFLLCSLQVAYSDEVDDYITKLVADIIGTQKKIQGTISFDATIGNVIKNENSYAIGVTVELFLNNAAVFKYTMGSVGIGFSQQEALENALSDWATLFVVPFKDYLLDAPDAIAIEEFKVYPSLVGIRGLRPSGWIGNEKERNDKFLRKILPYIRTEVSDYPAIVYLLLTVGKTSRIDGECRVNARISTAILDSLNELDWPVIPSYARYMLKQVYVIDK